MKYWKFNESIRASQASDRLNKLSAPMYGMCVYDRLADVCRSRVVEWIPPEDEKKNGTVRPGALRAKASERVSELAAPWPRKVTQAIKK